MQIRFEELSAHMQVRLMRDRLDQIAHNDPVYVEMLELWRTGNQRKGLSLGQYPTTKIVETKY